MLYRAVEGQSQNVAPRTFAAIIARAKAAFIDMCIATLLCAILMWALILAPAGHLTLAWFAGVLLAALILIELSTGVTPGKLLSHQTIRRFADPSRRPTIWQLLIRGVVRELPIFLFLPCLTRPADLITLLIWACSLGLVLCYMTTCYLMLMRIGRTLFDTAAGTTVIDQN